jgi:hypothetical protein
MHEMIAGVTPAIAANWRMDKPHRFRKAWIR